MIFRLKAFSVLISIFYHQISGIMIYLNNILHIHLHILHQKYHPFPHILLLCSKFHFCCHYLDMVHSVKNKIYEIIHDRKPNQNEDLAFISGIPNQIKLAFSCLFINQYMRCIMTSFLKTKYSSTPTYAIIVFPKNIAQVGVCFMQ